MRKNFICVALAAVLTSTLFASIAVEPLHVLQTGPLYPYGQAWIQTSHGKKLVAISVPPNLNVWDLTSQKLEKTVALPALSDKEYWRIENVSENSVGELVAIVGKYHGPANAGTVFAVNTGSGKILQLGTTDIGSQVYPLFPNAQNPAIAVALSHQVSTGNWTSTYLLLDTRSPKIVATLNADFSGDVHLFIDAHQRTRALIGGYEVVALWDPQSGTVDKLITHEQPSQWPTVLRDPNGTDLVQLNDGEDTVLYSYEKMKQGQLEVTKRLSKGQRILAIDAKDWVIEQAFTDNASIPLVERIRLSSYTDGATIGELPIGLGRGNLLVSRLKNGNYVGWYLGAKDPQLFVSPSRVLFGNFNQGQILYSRDYSGNIEEGDLAWAGGDRLLASVQSVESFPDKTTVFDLPSGTILSDTQTSTPLTGFLRFSESTVASLLATPASGDVCFVDWFHQQQKTCFPKGTFVKEGLPFWYTQLDQSAIAQGKEFAIPIIDTTGGKDVVTGYRSFRVRLE